MLTDTLLAELVSLDPEGLDEVIGAVRAIRAIRATDSPGPKAAAPSRSRAKPTPATKPAPDPAAPPLPA